MSKKLNNNHFVAGGTVAGLILASLLLSVSATAGTYSVRNDAELESVLRLDDPDKKIVFIDNVLVESDRVFEINPGDRVYMDLDRFNFQGNGSVFFEGFGNVTIKGSTTGFNGGLYVQNKITLTYDGIYSMSGTDYFGVNDGDNVTVNLTTPGSVWNGSVLPGPYVNTLSDVRAGTLVIGNEGKATMNVTNGNTVRNAETILGALAPNGEGSLNLSGKDADWFTSGSFYVGFGGKGTLNISNGINTRTGSIVVGKDAGAVGVLNITGAGTTVNLYGRQDNNQLMSGGVGVMNLTNGALLNFDESATRFGDLSGYAPKLGLGFGDSIVDHATVFGAISGKTGQIIGDQNGTLNDNSLTFQNQSKLEGSLKISMGTNEFKTGSIITPGLGTYRDHVGFGRFDFNNNTFIHQTDASTYIDFDVHGDMNCVPTVVYSEGYLGDKGRDFVAIQGDAELAGDVYFRPLSGYYSDHVDVDFMHISGNLTGQYERLHLTPSRWFRNPKLELAGGINHFQADRNLTPFTDVANSNNLRGVGGALNDIYNAQDNAEWLNVLDWMWMMEDNELRGAMRQLSGETRASSFLMPIRSPWRFVFDRTDLNEVRRIQREQQRDCGIFQSQPAQVVKNDLWATPFYDYFHASFDDNASAASNSRFGVLVGYDRVLSSQSTLGFLFAYSSSEQSQWYSRVYANDFLFGLHYNTLLQDRYELKLWGSYGTQAYRLRRELAIPDQDGRMAANYTGNTVALSAQVAMPIKWDAHVVRPFAALDLNVVQQNSARESGYEAIALRYSNADWAQLFGRVGVKADYTWRKWTYNASLSYAMMFAGDEAPTVKNQFLAGGSSFKVQGTDLGQHFFNFGLGGRRWLNARETQMLFVQYNSEYGKNSNEQTVSLGYQRAF